jgi:RNA-directed DNA polymerase
LEPFVALSSVHEGSMSSQRRVAEALADALLAGEASADGFVARAAWTLGRKPRWLAGFSRRVFRHFGSGLASLQRSRLVEFVQDDSGYRDAWTRTRKPRIFHYPLEPARMAPRPGALAACNLPALATPGDLAKWLGVSVGELDWFADVRGMIEDHGPLCHYTYRWVAKRHGYRLMEIPKSRLRAIQRKILAEILDPVPAHHAAHGFRVGHSCLSYARPHCGQRVVMRMDLRNFFPSIPGPRVHALFEMLGYPEATARLLAGICTNRVTSRMLRRIAIDDPAFRLSWIEGKQLGIPHLPQGAPTSPALSNLCALHLDLRLDALAQTLGGSYTRYADDLALSGGEPVRRRSARLGASIAAIAREEGFEVNHRKTRVMHASGRQVLTGVVVNEGLNVRRDEFDRLKAILTNCVTRGAASQNRLHRSDFRAHLLGRIGYVTTLNTRRGARLAAIFERIDWNS